MQAVENSPVLLSEFTDMSTFRGLKQPTYLDSERNQQQQQRDKTEAKSK